MQSKPGKKQSYFSAHRQKFIIPPLEKSIFGSTHDNYHSSSLNSASFKRNLLFSSTKKKSSSHKKITSDPVITLKNQDVKRLKVKQLKRGSTACIKEEPRLSGNNKFKVINTEVEQEVSWNKWKKRNINVAGKNFIMNLNTKIRTHAIDTEIEEKQNMEIFHLKHRIRELNSLKETIRITKKNNELIKKLEKESNDKIRVFFGKYEKIVQELK